MKQGDYVKLTKEIKLTGVTLDKGLKGMITMEWESNKFDVEFSNGVLLVVDGNELVLI